MKKTFMLLMILGGLVAIRACKHKAEVPEPSLEDFTEVPCDPDSIYFLNDILPLLKSSCAYTGCHDAATHKEGIVLNSYTNIMNDLEIKAGQPNEGDLIKVISAGDPNKVMPPPPNSPLTPDQIAMIRLWIEQGAENNGCDDCDTTTSTFAKQVNPVLVKNCISCHNASNTSGGVRLDSYGEVKKSVDNGRLEGSVNRQSGFVAMPKGGALTDCDLTKINKWIADGAQNN